MSMRGKKLTRAGKLSDSTIKRGRSKVESFVIHNTTDKEVDWMKAVSYTHLTLPTIYSV